MRGSNKALILAAIAASAGPSPYAVHCGSVHYRSTWSGKAGRSGVPQAKRAARKRKNLVRAKRDGSYRRARA